MKRVGGGSHNQKDHENSSDPDLLFLILSSEMQGLIRMGVWDLYQHTNPKDVERYSSSLLTFYSYLLAITNSYLLAITKQS